MSQQLFRRLEKFRNKRGLSILALCRQIETNNVNYHRWKKTKKITGAYKKIIEEFLDKNENPKSNIYSSLTSDIAVIGLSCYYPGASNIKELWENVLARRIQFRRMLDVRLPLSDYYDSDPKFPEKTYATKAALIDNFIFDWAKLRIPKKTFESTDIVHWLALDSALKAFEDAGYKLNDIPLQNTGVIVGNTLTGEQTRSQTLRLRWPYVRKTLNLTLEKLGLGQDERYRVSEAMEKVYKSAFYPITEDSLAGGLANTIAGRICNYLNLKGGGYIVDGACSSSLLAVATAANALKMGDVDLVLAGGVDISLDPFELVGFAKAGALAKDKMRVYDRNADGFIPGEGCGFVVLKRLEDALRDKNYIYATIRGWGISSDGKGGIMEPSTNGQALAIERAYKNISYKIMEIDFIEGHGTGTAKGDRVELEGLATAITKNSTKDLKRIYGITSFKSLVGHTKAAAGVGGFIKAVLAVNQRILPPTANCRQPNEIFEGIGKCLYPVTQGVILNTKKPVKGGVSSAGFGGINCHIAIESQDAPKKELKPSIDERALLVSNQDTEVFVFASKTVSLLKSLITKFKDDLHFISQAEMADLSARLTKNIKKKAPVKVAVVTDSPENLYQALCLIEEELAKDVPEGEILKLKSPNPNIQIFLSNNVRLSRIGFLYPGQASQRLNMTRVLFERFEWARNLSTVTKTPVAQYVYKPLDRFLTKEERMEFEKELSRTEITQLAVTFSSLMWSEFLSKLGVEPHAVSGHSLGELSAFYRAGALSKEELLKFAEFRGQAMAASDQKAGAMVSLLCSHAKAKELVNRVKGNLVIANINGPSQIVISGDKIDIEKLIKEVKKEDISTILLPVSNAFHSVFMRGAARKIKENKNLSRLFKPSVVNIHSCMDGMKLSGSVALNEYFSKQAISPLNFIDLIESMSKECNVFIEVGPGRVLTDLVKSINKDKGPICLPLESIPGNDRDFNLVLAELFIRNIPIRWEELYKNRLIRPFIPVSKKKFIVNQCERPLKVPEDIGKLTEDHSRIIQSTIQSMTPPKIGEPVSEASSSHESIPVTGDRVSETLIHFVERLTGFSKDSIQLNLRLLDDLNLDSIKAAELIAEVAKALSVAGEIEPAQYSNKTLDEIRQKFEELVKQKQGGEIQVGQTGILKRYSGKIWVRNFIEKFEPQALKEKNPDVLKTLKSVLILSDSREREMEIAGKIKNALKDIKVRIVTAEEVNLDKKPECVIAILPDSVESGLTKESLHQTMEQLYKIVTVATNSKHVLFVQLGSGDFKNSDIRAIASTLHLERSDLRLRIIDFNKNLKNQFITDRILGELQSLTDFTIAGYNVKSERQIPVFEVSNPASYKKRDIHWSKKDVVLVTGGAKGITAECALEFGRMTKAMMVLVGRSGKDTEIEKTLKRFKEEKLSCEYIKCDVTDALVVKQVIKDIEKRFGVVTAVIHGAGLNSLKRLKQAKLEEVYKESLPKIMGGANILEALKDRPLKLFVAMASIIGVTGMEGSGWYGFANETLVRYLRNFKIAHKGTVIIAPAFSVWDEIGMGIKLGSVEKLSERGIGAIPVAEGVKRFRELIERYPQADQVIITSRVPGLDTLRLNEFHPTQDWRFIEDIKYYLPQVELIVQAHLNVKDDSYVLDHNWKGSLLFPVVFGLEAMAQAVFYITGIEEIKSLRIKNINLERPISVSPESGTTIEIHAQVLEPEKIETEKRIKVEIYCEQTNYKEPHFSAVFEINPQIKVSEHRLIPKEKLKAHVDLDLRTDVYGSILFQGKLFQCIEEIHQLYYDTDDKKGECVFTSSCNKTADVFLKENKKFSGCFLIGDPFFIDSILQSMQLIIPQDISLPQDIQTIEFVPMKERSNARLISQSHIKKIDVDHYRGDAEVIGSEYWLKISNCRLKVLDTIIDHPSANDLVSPIQRDQVILDDNVRKYSRELGIQFPSFTLTYIQGIQNMGREDRHRIELPFIEKAVRSFLKKNGQSINSLEVKWQKNGKPHLLSSANVNPHISLTHEGSLVICALGVEEQAIDLQTVLPKTKEEWRSLLGNKKFEVIKNFTGEYLNYVATAIWTSGEVCIKAGQDNGQHDFQMERSLEKNFYILRNGKDLLISIVIKFSRGTERLLTFLIKNYKSVQEPSINEQLDFGEKYFHFHADYSGPQQQLVMIKKFPVTFKNNKMKSRRVYFCSYFDWMGEVREFALLPILKQLAGILETKEWGVATNNVKLDILGELRGGDIVEARMWLGRKINDNVYDLNFEFRKSTDENIVERVASAMQRISWVKILGHGKARVNKLPFFLEDIMQKMEPRSSVAAVNSTPIKELYKEQHFNLENLLEDYGNKELFLSEMKIQTTLEESNLVGNIYFANYPIWVGRATDYFFYNLWPEAYTNNAVNDEFVCIQCNIDHLNEAMPFDLINVRMYLNKLYANGIILKYEIYGNNDKKLAVARQSLLWIKRNKLMAPSVGNIPANLTDKLIPKNNYV